MFTERLWIAAIFALPLSVGIARGVRPLLAERERRKERRGLYHCLTVLSATFAAGTSFRGGLVELEQLFRGEKKGLVRVVATLNRAFEMKKSLKPVKEELPQLLDNRESILFFEMMIDAVYSGANKKVLIERTSNTLQTMIELEEEMDKIINAKKMEALVISLMPILFVFLLRTFFTDYLAPMQSTVEGQAVLYGSLFLLVVAEYLMFQMVAKAAL